MIRHIQLAIDNDSKISSSWGKGDHRIGQCELTDVDTSKLLMSADPDHLCLVQIQLEAVPFHPKIDLLDTVDKALYNCISILSWSVHCIRLQCHWYMPTFVNAGLFVFSQ
jgi:hypothetical protein